MKEKRVNLGASGIRISPICLGTWPWGSRFLWGYGKTFTEQDAFATYEESLNKGINFLDTAEIYGMGQSERLIGQFIRRSQLVPPLISTKFMPHPLRRRPALKKALKNSLKRLGQEKVELYHIHRFDSVKMMQVWLEEIADCYEEGLITSVAVSNYQLENFKQAYEILDKRGIKLAANQMHYSLLHRADEYNGLLDLCKELSVTYLAYSPLEQGVLTGKFTPQNPPKGVLRRAKYTAKKLELAIPLIEEMRAVCSSHRGCPLSQVAINWVIAKGAVPIVGAKNQPQARENSGALDWELAQQEVSRLDEAAEEVIRSGF